MFSVTRREGLRRLLLDRARADERVVGAAVTGSQAEGREDLWSDIDLFFGVREGTPVEAVVADWSAFFYEELGAVHHFQLSSAGATYHAFLLHDGLEVDLGFAPADLFAPVGSGAFDVVFGAAGVRRPIAPDIDFLVGMAWHHVLHARTAIGRGALWAAEHWITATRDVVLTLASVRHGLPYSYAKGADALPAEVTEPLRATLVGELSPSALAAALRAATAAVLTEVSFAAPAVAARLGPLLADGQPA